MSFRPVGRPALKNISEPIEVFEVDRVSTGGARPVATARGAVGPAPARHPSIAVLALTNLSGDPAVDHLCEGIVGDIIANLSRFHSLMVIAGHSAFLFSLKSHPAREIGKRLGVRYLLTGNLRRAGKKMRIGVELIDAESEGVLWSDNFNIEVEELFDLQDEITGAVASRLAVQIDLAERRQESQYPRDMRAHGLVLRAQHLMLQFSKEANAHARRLCEEAMEIAPDYSRAYSALSRASNLDWRYSWSPDPEASLDSALDFARNAIQRDPLDARGFAELGFGHLYKKRHEESLTEYARAMALNPNDADIMAEYADFPGVCGTAGQIGRTAGTGNAAQSLLSRLVSVVPGRCLLFAGALDRRRRSRATDAESQRGPAALDRQFRTSRPHGRGPGASASNLAAAPGIHDQPLAPPPAISG
jgi:adenylate cyclase